MEAQVVDCYNAYNSVLNDGMRVRRMRRTELSAEKIMTNYKSSRKLLMFKTEGDSRSGDKSRSLPKIEKKSRTKQSEQHNLYGPTARHEYYSKAVQPVIINSSNQARNRHEPTNRVSRTNQDLGLSRLSQSGSHRYPGKNGQPGGLQANNRTSSACSASANVYEIPGKRKSKRTEKILEQPKLQNNLSKQQIFQMKNSRLSGRSQHSAQPHSIIHSNIDSSASHPSQHSKNNKIDDYGFSYTQNQKNKKSNGSVSKANNSSKNNGSRSHAESFQQSNASTSKINSSHQQRQSNFGKQSSQNRSSMRKSQMKQSFRQASLKEQSSHKIPEAKQSQHKDPIKEDSLLKSQDRRSIRKSIISRYSAANQQEYKKRQSHNLGIDQKALSISKKSEILKKSRENSKNRRISIQGFKDSPISQMGSKFRKSQFGKEPSIAGQMGQEANFSNINMQENQIITSSSAKKQNWNQPINTFVQIDPHLQYVAQQPQSHNEKMFGESSRKLELRLDSVVFSTDDTRRLETSQRRGSNFPPSSSHVGSLRSSGNFQPHSLEGVLEGIQIHLCFLDTITQFKEATREFDEDQEYVDLLCFLLDRKFFYQMTCVGKALKGDKNIFRLTQFQIETEHLRRYLNTPDIIVQVTKIETQNRQRFKALQQQYLQHKQANKSNPYFKLETPSDNFSKQIVRILEEQILEIYEKMKTNVDVEDEEVYQRRIVAIMETVFLFSELAGRKVKRLDFWDEIFQYYEDYCDKYQDALVDAFEFFRDLP